MREEIKKKIVEHLINDELVDKISQPPSFMLKPRPRVEDGEPDPDDERKEELKEKCARCGKKRTTDEYPVVEQRRLQYTKTGYHDYLPALKGHACHTCASTAEQATKALQKLFEKEKEEAERENMDQVLVCCSDCGNIHKLKTPCPICNCDTIKGMKMAQVKDMDVVVIEIPNDRFDNLLNYMDSTYPGEEVEEFVVLGRSLGEEE